jgi:hypothetical protein
VTAAAASTAARLAVRVGSCAAAVLGGALYAAGCAWYVTRMGAKPQYLSSYLPGTVFASVGIALILPTLTSAAVMAVPARRLAAVASSIAALATLALRAEARASPARL